MQKFLATLALAAILALSRRRPNPHPCRRGSSKKESTPRKPPATSTAPSRSSVRSSTPTRSSATSEPKPNTD